MARAEALKRFQEREGKEIVNRCLTELNTAFERNKEQWTENFKTDFLKACEKIVEQQKKGKLNPIQFMIVTLFRSRLKEKNYYLSIQVTNEKWWLDSDLQEAGNYNAAEIFSYYEKMQNQLEQARKIYVGKTISQDVIIESQKQVKNFLRYIGKIAQIKILDIADSSVFQAIQTTGKILIYVGEYFDSAEWIYEERRRERTLEEWKEVIEKLHNKKQKELCFQDLRNSVLSNWDLSGSDFRFTNFQNSNLEGADFRASLLYGTIFRGSKLCNSIFRGSILTEANFENCDLKNCDFRKSEAKKSEIYSIHEFQANTKKVSFRGADLRNANLSESQLKSVDFTGACMIGTLLNKEQWEMFPLSSKQKQQVKVIK